MPVCFPRQARVENIDEVIKVGSRNSTEGPEEPFTVILSIEAGARAGHHDDHRAQLTPAVL